MSIENLFSLKGKTALITGGYRGLGKAMAESLAEAGATVILNGRTENRIIQCVDEFRSKGLDAHSSIFDVTSEEAVTESIASIIKEHGKIDILINNAGIQKRNLLVDMPLADWQEVMDTNLTGAFLVGKIVATNMIESDGGKIINICSLMSELTRPTIANYAAAKGGLKMLTRSMTGEWAKHNIQVNGIAPGYFVTELNQALVDDPDFNSWICNRTPSGRWGMPDELKGLAVFLASPASDYINGQLIYVDGGLTAVV